MAASLRADRRRVSGDAVTQGQATCLSLVIYSVQEEQGESRFGTVEKNEQAEDIFREFMC